MKKALTIATVIFFGLSIAACGSSGYSDDYVYDYDFEYGSSYNDDYDYDKGYGYTEPEEGESLSDYIKRQDPDLYESMEERWNSLG